MKATDLLKEQHRETEKLFAKIEKSDGAARATLIRELASKLAAHMRIEEEILYPIAREISDDTVMEALEEHTLAAFELKRLADVGLAHETVSAKVKALKELIEHHVKEEEREMLPKLDKHLDRARNEEVGARMEARFERIVATGYGAELFPKGNGSPKRPKEQRAQR